LPKRETNRGVKQWNECGGDSAEGIGEHGRPLRPNTVDDCPTENAHEHVRNGANRNGECNFATAATSGEHEPGDRQGAEGIAEIRDEVAKQERPNRAT